MAKKFIVRGDIKKEPAMIIEDQLIVSPGEYYGISLTEDKIKEHIRLTDWTDKWNTALIYGHKTNTADKWIGNPSPADIAGHYSVPTYKTVADGADVDGAYSNIYIYDEDLTRKLAYGRLKCGVSATFDLEFGGIKNLSIIDNPKCKQAFLNLADDDGKPKIISIISPKYLNLSEHDMISNSSDSSHDEISDDPIVTSIENGHSHMARVDENGRGATISMMINGEPVKEEHVHLIIGFNILEAEGHTHTIPKLLNLADNSNLTTTERGENSNTMTDKNETKTEKEIVLEKEIEELKKQIADKPATPAEPAVEITAPVEPVTPVTPVTKAPEPAKEPVAPVAEPAAPVATNLPTPVEPVQPADPVVITSESSNDSPVVEAIEKMADRVTEELKKAKAPETVAPTSPNQISSRDDEVTQALVDKYTSLHKLE